MILDTIAASTLERVAAEKEKIPLAEQIARAGDLSSNTGLPFEQALAKPGMSFICEVKKASPSKGLIAAEFPYVQIAKEYEAAGADAVLLICAILSPMQLTEYAGIAAELGLSALVEAHDEREVEMARKAGAKIIGVNNRNLKYFTVDINNSIRLRELVPENILFVSESGMKTRQDIARLEQNGTNTVLIGETLMRSADKRASLTAL